MKVMQAVRSLLDPRLSNDELGSGVTFPSAGFGYNEITKSVFQEMPIKNHIPYFENYMLKNKVI